MNNLLDKKKEFRKKQFNIRKKLFQNIFNTFNKKLFEELFTEINFDSINIVSSFVSINTEINTNELNNYILKKRKYYVCL